MSVRVTAESEYIKIVSNETVVDSCVCNPYKKTKRISTQKYNMGTNSKLLEQHEGR